MPRLAFFTALVWIVIAFSIQIQLTFFQTADYAGIRLNITDMLLPLVGIIIMLSLFFKKSAWPHFQVNSYLILFGLSVIIIASFLHGVWRYQEINQWALINKTAGWFILCSYFMLGGWLKQNSAQNHIEPFFKYFLFGFTILTIALLCIYLLPLLVGVISSNSFFAAPFSALMGNKNAYIFIYLFCIALSIIWNTRIKNIPLLYIFISLLPLIFVLTGSRMILIALPLFIVLYFVIRPSVSLKKIILSLLIGAIMILILSTAIPQLFRYVKVQHFSFIHTSASESVHQPSSVPFALQTTYEGDKQRLQVLDTTLNMIKQRPITGHGLASSQYEQQKQWGRTFSIIDCTVLWLWAETGLIGLLGFLFFYWLCLKHAWNMHRSKDALTRKVGQSLLCLLIVFAFMSLLHEILYTRFLWLIMGMCLAFPAIQKPQSPS